MLELLERSFQLEQLFALLQFAFDDVLLLPHERFEEFSQFARLLLFLQQGLLALPHLFFLVGHSHTQLFAALH